MMFRAVLRQFAGVLVALTAGGALGGAPVSAQQSDLSGPVVLVVDMNRLLNGSASGLEIKRQADALRNQYNREMESRRQSLRAEEEEMVSLRETLERETFNLRAEEFEQKVGALKRDARDMSSLLQRAVFRETEKLRDAATAVLIEIMGERNGQVLLEKSEIVLSANELDITEEAIRRLDAKELDIELRLVRNGDGG